MKIDRQIGILSMLLQRNSVTASYLADLYQNDEKIQKECDKQYGEGVAVFFAEAIRHFYDE